ncbi:hypothetical protein LCL61_28200 [Amycolatopsis coloradensis]|uniref:Uncharacterized protein n=1 Tax=Amycolatopsis coloradensis TaxID=76021 RepID=A0ACD5BJJ9_9PSEU
MEHLWYEIGSCAAGALRADVARYYREGLLDERRELQAYLDGEEYDLWYGEFWEASPIELILPHDDFWYLVIDSYPGHVRFGLEGPFN